LAYPARTHPKILEEESPEAVSPSGWGLLEPSDIKTLKGGWEEATLVFGMASREFGAAETYLKR
jgi:hypothetical protein